MARLIGIRPNQFVVENKEWYLHHLIREAEYIWSDYQDQVHGNGWQKTRSAIFETRRWEIIDGWVIRFAKNARAEDVAQAKIWLEDGPENALGVINFTKTEKYKSLIREAEKEKQKRTTEEFEEKITSLELWKYVVAAGAANNLAFGWPDMKSSPEKFLAAFEKGEELQKMNPVKFFFKNTSFHLSFEEGFRWQGNTGRQHNWVIAPDGQCRSPNCRKFDNNGRSFSDGQEKWEYILPDELVLVWEKEYTASSHIFKVVHKPLNITVEQKNKINELEEFAENQFKNAVGISGKRSPGIGDGFKV